jgi:NhaP-type Na+/H+ or K+/H+ antiporter
MLTDLAVIILAALLGNWIFGRVGLPGILGMMGAGVLIGPSGLDIVEGGVLAFLAEAKTVALIVILIRAGLGISRSALHRVGGPAVRMGILPVVVEGAAVTAASYALLGLPFYESGMLGFIVASVSPAVVVPAMLELREGGFGNKKEVPTLALAGSSLDNVFAITIFGVFAGLAAGAAADPLALLVKVPGGILLGAALGIGIGFALVRLFDGFEMRDTKKVIVFMIIAVVFYDLSEEPAIRAVLPIAALLGIMAIGFVILERDSDVAHRLASKFGKIWVLAEILLFVYIGAEVRLDQLTLPVVGVGLLVLAIGLTARSVGVWASLAGSGLSMSERLFCIIAFWPKATVQAAVGPVPLAMVLTGTMVSTTVEMAQTILAIAVLSIAVTAPLGAIGIKLAGPRLLARDLASP